jgi:2-methylaconitate cis-trans-isomerase PrpF
VYVRGGTSRALVFRAEDLPPGTPPRDCSAWNPIFLAAIGSPDPNGRQLNGVGGGISSLSKVAVVGPSTREDADVDFTFAQVGVFEPTVSYRGTCGNISSAIGPFAVDEGLVATRGDAAMVRVHNTNTGKVFEARFPLVDGRAAVEGDTAIAGVAGTGAAIQLRFRDPGGAATGRLLPTGKARDTLRLAGGRAVEVSLVDAANPLVFIGAASIGATGSETVDQLDANTALLGELEEIRVAAAVAMGIASEAEARSTMRNMPLVTMIAPAADPATADVQTRVVSAGQAHRAVPLTAAMCIAVAARIPGTIVADCVDAGRDVSADLRVAHVSGVLPVAATVRVDSGTVIADEAIVYRTARRLMQGEVLVP